MKKQSLLVGSLILGVAGILAKFLGIFFRWPLIMLIGDEGVGYYQMTYPLYMFFVAACSGIPVAISKLVSENNALGDEEESYSILKESLKLMFILGTCTTFLLLVFPNQIIEFLDWSPKSYYSLIGIAFAPMIVSVMTTFRGFFQGMQNMVPSAISQVLEQLGRVIVGVGLAILFLPKGIEFSAGGAAFGAAAGGTIAGIYLVDKYRKVRKQSKVKKIKSNSKILKKLLQIAIPMSLGATAGTIMNLIDSIIVPKKLLEAGFTYTESTVLYAQLTGKASVITNIPLTLSMALCASLVPIIAENYVLKKRNEVENKVNMSMRLSSVIALPSFAGLFCLAFPIMQVIFPGKYEGHEILKYLSIAIPFIILSQTTTSILQGTGNYIMPVVNLLIGCIVKVCITLYLVPMKELNVYGAVIASILAYVVASLLNIIYMRIKIKVKISYYNAIVKPGFASIIMSVIVSYSYMYLYTLWGKNSVACLISIFMGIIIYVVLIIIFRVFDYDYIKSRFKRS